MRIGSVNFGLLVWFLAFVTATIRHPSAEESAATINPWSIMAAPTHDKAEAIGSPNHGCLAGAAPLPREGPGYQVGRPERRRYFGHPELVDFIEALARRAQAAGLPLLYVGDMSQPRGGPIPSSHHSHETGLDVDLWFTFGPNYAPGAARRQTADPRSMLQPGGAHLDPARFGANQMTLLRFALADPRVERIFVNPAIKLALCHGASGANYFGTAWLRRLQPWSGHDDHFHVRLRCPETSHACEPPAKTLDGDGCDAVWTDRPADPFLPEATPQPVPASHLVACQRLLRE